MATWERKPDALKVWNRVLDRPDGRASSSASRSRGYRTHAHRRGHLDSAYDSADVDAHVAGHDAKRARYLGAFPSTPEKVLEWIEANQMSWANGGPIYNFGVVEVATDELVGMVEANTSAEQMEGVAEGEANISYNIYPRARRQGYATRAVGWSSFSLMEARSGPP